MKIRQQILILLVLPIVSQLSTVALLWTSMKDLDRSVRQEASAKRVVSLLHEMSGLMGEALVRVGGSEFYEIASEVAKAKEVQKRIEEKGNELCLLVEDNREASRIAEDYKRHLMRFVGSWIDVFDSYTREPRKVFFGQFVSRMEFSESIKVQLDRIKTDAGKLIAIYGPLVNTLHPEAIRQRNALESAVVVAVVSNVVLVLVLSSIVNQKTLARLTTLMTHIKSFGKGKESFTALTGEDELAELDKTFLQMADERARLDQLRQSIREMVNHDMRSPLTSVTLRLESIIEIDGDELSARTLSSLHALSAETQRLARLAHTLLDVDRMEDGKLDIDFVKVSAAELVKSSTAVQAAQAERRKIQLVENVEEGLELKCDVDRTIQVLTNLLSNALKFCPRNSTITVSAFSASDDWARFEVIDQGTGVPSEQAANLFVRFKQLDQPAELKTQGSGLGLFICKSLVEAQGGRIGYREREEPGACFWIELPRA